MPAILFATSSTSFSPFAEHASGPVNFTYSSFFNRASSLSVFLYCRCNESILNVFKLYCIEITYHMFALLFFRLTCDYTLMYFFIGPYLNITTSTMPQLFSFKSLNHTPQPNVPTLYQNRTCSYRWGTLFYKLYSKVMILWRNFPLKNNYQWAQLRYKFCEEVFLSKSKIYSVNFYAYCMKLTKKFPPKLKKFLNWPKFPPSWLVGLAAFWIWVNGKCILGHPI